MSIERSGAFVSGDLQQVHAVHGQCVLIKETNQYFFLVSKFYFTFLAHIPHKKLHLNLSLHIFPNLKFVMCIWRRIFFFFFCHSVSCLINTVDQLYISEYKRDIYFYPLLRGARFGLKKSCVWIVTARSPFLDQMLIEIFIGLQTNSLVFKDV